MLHVVRFSTLLGIIGWGVGYYSHFVLLPIFITLALTARHFETRNAMKRFVRNEIAAERQRLERKLVKKVVASGEAPD